MVRSVSSVNSLKMKSCMAIVPGWPGVPPYCMVRRPKSKGSSPQGKQHPTQPGEYAKMFAYPIHSRISRVDPSSVVVVNAR